MSRAAPLLLALVLALPASGAERLERATAVIETGGASVVVQVEVADSPSERERGLMARSTLSARAGMVFLFEREQRGGFWMKNTLIPLSIAFLGREGRVLALLDMVPCRRDPCPVYSPGVAYRSALEVNRGAFRRWGIVRGDRVLLRRPGA